MEKEKNKPKLRFPGFTDAWKQRKLGDLYKINNERNKDLIAYDKTFSIATMTYKDEGNGAADTSLSTYKVLRIGDIAFEGHTNKEFRYGRFVANDVGDGIMSPRFSTLRPICKMPVSFWKYSIHYEPIMRKILVCSTKAGTMMNELIPSDFFAQDILVPCIEEQEKLGTYFNQLDNLITLHQRKCEAVKTYKKCMLQKMFPKEGESIPEIRFPGFTDAWEQRKCSDFIKFVGGATPSKSNKSYWNGDIIWLSSQEINMGGFVDSGTYTITDKALDDGTTKLVKADTPLFISRSGILAHSFPITRPTKDVAINQDIKAMLFDRELYFTDFIVYMMENKADYILKSIVKSGTTVQSVSMPDMEKMEVCLPEIKEQHQIGMFFLNLDNLITLHQRECEKLIELKKCLLQQMLV